MSSLIVTTSWDDGTMPDIKLAELLDKFNIKGTFYTSRSHVDEPLLQEKDIVAIDGKFEVGAHTLSHPDLTKVSPLEAKKEIEDSKAYLEDLLGHSVAVFCYPYGSYNEDVKKMVKDSGFIAARTIQGGSFNVPEDPYQWHVTLVTSGTPFMITWRIWRQYGLWKRALVDWENHAKSLFDLAVKSGGIYHIRGHSAQLLARNQLGKFERVLSYISNREGVEYMTNGEIFHHITRRSDIFNDRELNSQDGN